MTGFRLVSPTAVRREVGDGARFLRSYFWLASWDVRSGCVWRQREQRGQDRGPIARTESSRRSA